MCLLVQAAIGRRNEKQNAELGGANPSLSAKQSSQTSDLTALSKRVLRLAPKSVPKAWRYAA